MDTSSEFEKWWVLNLFSDFPTPKDYARAAWDTRSALAAETEKRAARHEALCKEQGPQLEAAQKRLAELTQSVEALNGKNAQLAALVAKHRENLRKALGIIQDEYGVRDERGEWAAQLDREL